MKIDELVSGMKVEYHGYMETFYGTINFVDVETQSYITLTLKNGCNILVYRKDWKKLTRI
jgi:predicted nucleic acid-binding protein